MKAAFFILPMLVGFCFAQQSGTPISFHFHNTTSKTNTHLFNADEPLTEVNFQKGLAYLESIHDSTELEQKTNLFIQENNLRAFQIARLIELFPTDNERLKLALEAYPRCIDKDNYNVVSYKLKLVSNKEALKAFISRGLPSGTSH